MLEGRFTQPGDPASIAELEAHAALLERQYTAQDHTVWSQLYARQMERIQGLTCRAFEVGLAKLAYNPTRLPDARAVSQYVYAQTGWYLTTAQNEYLGPLEWFEHIHAGRFPVTDYIRQPDELDFTPLPDLFHEYFGHLAFFTDPFFADVAQQFGTLYLMGDERQRTEIAKLWWFTTEFAFIMEDGVEKVLGAGLLSSPGELTFARESGAPHHRFTIDHVVRAKPAAYSFHEEYFVLDDMAHFVRIPGEYAVREGLPLLVKEAVI